MSSPPPRPSLRGALATVFLNRYVVLAINLATTMILSRLLTPSETGLFSIAASVILIAQTIRDFGVAEFLVQEKDLSPGKIRTAFGITLVLAWTLGVIVFTGRHLMADMYGSPELSDLLGVVSLSFLVVPFSSTVMALLNRDMAFGKLFRISLASNVANAVVAVGLAWFGWGAMALALGMLAMNVTTAVVAGLSARSWDHLLPSLREWRVVIGFGSYMSGTNIVNQVCARAPDLIVGHALGNHTLGIYNRGLGVVFLFYEVVVSSVQTVAFPAFAAANRAGEDILTPYLRAVTLISGAVVPVLGVVGIAAHPLVGFLLGEQWLPAVPLIRLIAVAIAVETLAPIIPHFLGAIGWVRALLPLAAATRASQLAIVAIGAQFGIEWVAAGLIASSLLNLVITAAVLHRCVQLSLGQLLRAGGKSGVVALVSAVLPLGAFVLRADAGDPYLVSLILAFGSGGISWLVAITVLGHPLRRELMALFHELPRLLRRR